MTHKAIIPPDAKRIVIIMPSWVGDVVMATPVCRALRERCPEAQITAIVRPGLEALLNGLRSLDHIAPGDHGGVTGPWRIGRLIRSSRPEIALLLPNSFRSALAARLGGAPVRIGFRRDGRGFLLSDPLDPPPRDRQPVPTRDEYLHLTIRALGIESVDPALELAVTDEERTEADRLLAGAAERIILINPGANKSAKCWPPESFAELADTLRKEPNVTIAFNGAPREAELIARIRALMAHGDGAIDLAQRGVTLGSLKAVIDRAALLITNDTGPRHIAAALGTPLVTLFGPTDPRWTHLPEVDEAILRAEPFLPEDRIADDHAPICRIDRISVGDVVHAARRELNGKNDPR